MQHEQVLGIELTHAGVVDKPPTRREQAPRRLRDPCSNWRSVTLLSTVAAMLADAIYAQQRYDEADRFIELSDESAGPEDVFTHALSRSLRAELLARRGDMAQALMVGREALDLAESSNSLHLQWYANLAS